MDAEIISVGTEILLGQIVNTNTQYISKKLAQMGIDLFFQTSVGDNKERLIKAIDIAVKRADLIIFTGGLGPTRDDLTKEALADYLNMPLIIDDGVLSELKGDFKRRNRQWVDSNARQAEFISGSYILQNDLGTAPGMAIKVKGKSYILLPGPPNEMKHMMDLYATNWIIKNNNMSNNTIYSHVLKFMGISESKLEEELKDLFLVQKDITLALLAKTGEIHLRISAKESSKDMFKKKMQPIYKEILDRVGIYVIAENDESI